MWVADGNWTFQVVSMPHSGHEAAAAFDDLVQFNDDCHLVHTVEGRAELLTGDGRVHETSPGCVVSVPVYELCRWRKRSGQPWRMINIHLRIHTGEGVALHERDLLPVSFVPGGLKGIHRDLKSWGQRWGAGGWRERMGVSGSLIGLAGEYLAAHGLKQVQATAADDLIVRAQQAMDQQAAEPLDVGKVAMEHGLSLSQFNRRFKAAMGISPGAYMVRQRLSMAQSLLADSVLSVTGVSEALGFADVYYFSKWFRKQSGMSPSQYRLAGPRL